MKHFTESELWLGTHLLSLRIHVATEATPPNETSTLRAELRCAAVGIPATVAQALRTPVGPAQSRLWCLAQTSAVDAEELLFLCRDAGLMSVEEAGPLLQELDVLVEALVPLASPEVPRRPPPPPPLRPVTAEKSVAARILRRNGTSRVH